jgi:hypothetical protein
VANQKISALSSGNPAASSDELVIARSGANYKVTAASLAALRLPAGSAGQVQYNLAGALAGTSTISISGTVVTWADATTWVAGTTTGLTIGTATTQKLGFYNATPVVQQATTGTTTGFTAGGPANGVHADSTFTGGSGTKAYRISDIVLALKNLGLLAAS